MGRAGAVARLQFKHHVRMGRRVLTALIVGLGVSLSCGGGDGGTDPVRTRTVGVNAMCVEAIDSYCRGQADDLVRTQCSRDDVRAVTVKFTRGVREGEEPEVLEVREVPC